MLQNLTLEIFTAFNCSIVIEYLVLFWNFFNLRKSMQLIGAIKILMPLI